MRIFQKIHHKLNWSTRQYIMLVVAAILLTYLASAIYHTYKPLPQGLDYTGKLRHAQVQFLADQSYVDQQGKSQVDQQIFKQMLQLIDQAQSMIVLDMFLFNQNVGTSQQQQSKLTATLTQALIQKKRDYPHIEIKLITDPINSVYGGIAPEHYRQLRQNGIDVIETNLVPLRASNPTWSALWYMCCQGVGNNSDKGWLANPVGEGKVTLRSYFNLLNFKANHRKTMVVNTVDGWKTLVSSMNPHDGSSRHSNVALLVDGYTAVDVLQTERTVAQMSQGDISSLIIGEFATDQTLPQVQVLTEQAILKQVLSLISSAKAEDHIDLTMFYLSERQIIQALIAAKARGVKLRILLDPNKDAFGREKNGIPNRQVAMELHQAGVDVRWCNTQGEQCHGKMILKWNKQDAELILGSANFTARNLKNYNLETDLRVIGTVKAPVFVDAQRYFNTAWLNLNGRNISVDYAKYADESQFKYWVYRFMEWSGWSTF
ncbi:MULTISPECIES: phospholipase D-like domain-containing protein [unclassified Acinetobacter]|uniref:phospholipase D-like domain-containing protein n=1 Tax=unclassified Acinetobacter TaxID=196816 RepID=UPI002934BB40|nr:MULTISPECIES: phospholipase D-like domain-containing protein [unclassified Acinetobacter]WOE31285.1 phospholipase D-like domain-containing protein [Acinetobacter sp. SAAs470]WOE39481.1 phospholipase D-like domain-containing protein [Acinetobacter sp. SAAs474]